MNKLFENKQRKRIRLVMCFIYLFQIFLCTAPFVMLSNNTKLKDESVFSIIYKVMSNLDGINSAGGFVTYLPYFFLVIIPVAGFFFCALDKERNLKNIFSVIFNFLAIMIILMVVPAGALQIGSVLQILLYIVLTFLATAGMLMRLNKNREEPEKPEKKKIPKEEREY
ncbi:MAG TPA: hypothetical protein DEO32_06430 [Ruminococcaceae bacterium]|nr:hypothetical protein [Oscillospiraceae bacterium]